MLERFYLGVDGGQSGTTAVIGDETGLHYVGSDDIADDPEAWGLTQAAAGYGIRIYRVAR